MDQNTGHNRDVNPYAAPEQRNDVRRLDSFRRFTAILLLIVTTTGGSLAAWPEAMVGGLFGLFAGGVAIALVRAWLVDRAETRNTRHRNAQQNRSNE